MLLPTASDLKRPMSCNTSADGLFGRHNAQDDSPPSDRENLDLADPATARNFAKQARSAAETARLFTDGLSHAEKQEEFADKAEILAEKARGWADSPLSGFLAYSLGFHMEKSAPSLESGKHLELNFSGDCGHVPPKI
jgi:hypothetical protein